MRTVIACLPAACVCAAAGCLSAAPAAAADLPTAPSNYPALGPGAADVAPDYWAGLSVGAGISVWGGKGIKGGVGGDTELTYEHAFDNGIMLGVQASTGYMPFLQASPGFSQFTGSAFAGGSAIVGYNLGRVTPYLITGVDFVRATRFTGGAFNASDAVNRRILRSGRRAGGRHVRRRGQLSPHPEFQRGARGGRAHLSERRGPICAVVTGRPSPDGAARPKSPNPIAQPQ